MTKNSPGKAAFGRLFCWLACLVLAAAPAFGQGAVQQSGPITPGHLAIWTRDHLVQDGGPLTPPGSVTGLVQVANNAALQNLATNQSSTVFRAGFTSAGDGGALWYNLSTSACSLNGGNGDNGWQVKASNGNCWIANFPVSGVSPRAWGADATGGLDATAILQAASNALSGTQTPLLLDGVYSVTTPGVTFWAGVAWRGVSGPPQAAGGGPSGGYLKCNNQVVYTKACVVFSGSTYADQSHTWYTQSADNLTVIGTPGSVPVSGSVGVMIDAGIGAHFSNLTIQNFNTCLDAVGRNYDGYNLHLSNPLLTKCNRYAVQWDGWAAAHIDGGVIGDTGDGNYTANSAPMHFTDSQCNTGGCGPNTITVDGLTVIVPASITPPSCSFAAFDNYLSGYNGANGNNKFSNIHVELNTATRNPFFCSDSTVKALANIFVSNSEFQNDAGGNPLFGFNPATQLQFFYFNNIYLTPLSTIVLNPSAVATNGLYFLNFDNIHNPAGGSLNWSLTANGTGNAVTISNSDAGPMLIAGPWATLRITNLSGPGTSGITDTATGTVCWNEPPQTFTPVMQFGGGAATGWTFSTLTGQFRRTLDCGFQVAYQFVVGTVGSATGAVTIGGLPVTCVTGINEVVPAASVTVSTTTPGVPEAYIGNTNYISFNYYSASGGFRAALQNTNINASGDQLAGIAKCSLAL